ncbi:hypothetical protein [Paraburkholderia solisilvae]|uniref:Short-chain dehydrogenase/reductase SDR n=1 Tax=Paraburkholderia solisilvae TaxID=624376 RepID=A0A6J5DVC5_9BURK|nr:hypothetical protein LMG29739_02569 [Paraburkholderia solisilvae]
MKTVLIVGASRGIGWEFARQYRQAGLRDVLAQAAGAPPFFHGRFFQYDGTPLDW